ncbi:MAG TPA: PAS domain S-box protein [Leptospiraceae bacterium]|nr:PAS domain S-box protein [Leptospiraceae bacterium]HMY67476.1 PAS domain S-box protein [Leptospiraceae bacterium]HNF12584.1 PAS domain S-box protein [Leptospiraceae bacterium]HNF25402.1 PAS domain S-box protein [Leptospiraceae bacterium]HNM02751.1 PAS domain S-box protein [Leptospiraceae bacterium]
MKDSKSILFIEDSELPQIREIENLKKSGYDIIPVKSGEEALRSASANGTVNLVMMDMREDRKDLVQKILSERNLPILFVVSDSDIEYIDKVREFPNCTYMMKNSDEFTLKSSVDAAFELFDANELKKENEESLKVTLQSIGDAVITADLNRKVSRMNASAEALTGWSFKEAENKRLEDVFKTVNIDSFDSLKETVESVIKNGRTARFSEHAILTDRQGKTHYVSVNVSPIQNGKKKINGIIIVFTDITDKYIAEQRLKDLLSEKEFLFRLFSENSIDLIFRFDFLPKGRFTYLSPAVSAMTGYNPDEFYAYPEFVNKLIFPKDLSLWNSFISGEIPSDSPTALRWIKKSGEIIWIELRCAMEYDKEGNIAGIEGIARDISRRKKSEDLLHRTEEIYQHTFKYAPIGIANTSLNGRLLTVNRKFCDILGYRQEELLSMTFRDFTHPDFISTSEELLEKGRTGETPNFIIEKKYIRKDGTVIWGRMSNLTVKNEDGSADYFIETLEDITEQKKAEAEIQEREAKYRILLETMSEGAALNEIIYNEKGEMSDYRIIEVNRAFYSMADFTGTSVIGNTASEIYGLSSDVIAEFWKEHRGSNTTQYTKFISPLNGRHFMISTSPFLNDRFVTVFFDITDSEEARTKLQESENRFRTMADCSPALIWMSGTDSLCSFFNKTWLEYTGKSMEEELGCGWAKGVHPDDLENCIKIYTECFQNRKPFAMEYRLKRKDGTYGWIYDQGVPRFSDDSEFEGYIGSCTDISELKKANEEIIRISNEREMILESTGSGVLLLKDRKIVWANKRAANLFGYTLEELTSISLIKPYPYAEIFNHLGSEMYSVLARAFRFSTETEQKKKSGETFWCRFTGKLLDPKDPEKGSIWILEDITQRKQAEFSLNICHKSLEIMQSQLAEKNRELGEINEVKEKFLSVIANKLSSPFRTFLGLSELMADESDSLSKKDMQEFSREIHLLAEKLHKNVDNLLSWSAVRNGTVQFSPILCNLRKIAQNSISLLSESARQKGIDFFCSVKEDIYMLADHSMIEAVLRNLISNAVKFTPKGGRISVSTSEYEDEILISIEDSGIGMDEKILKSLFISNEKISSPGTEEESSTGLGLLLCQEFIRRHNGKIRAESVPGKGTSFYVSLPKHL